ncbi:MAG: hypothetical protein HYY62_02940, partial [Deltaproteobacteria bacterium]|nr:hypothetical protein [Deltaproteobacteria bacterium]
LFLILLAGLPSWAQESGETPTVPADQELLKLKLKVDCSENGYYVGSGCSGGLEDAAKTFSILKVTPSPSGGIAPNSLYLEKHTWENNQFTITTHPTETVRTEDRIETLVHYPSSAGTLTLKYSVGTFDPETKTQDFIIESIQGLASLREGGNETKKKISFRWTIKQNEDGSLEIWDTSTTPQFKLQNLELGIGAWYFGNQKGATYLERQGEREVEAEDGTKQRVPVNQREIVLKASCSDSTSPVEKLMDSTQTIFEKI